MLGRWGLFAGLLLTAITVGAPAPADAKPKSKKARVKAYKKKAFRQFADGDYGAGIASMEKANALIPHPGFLLNIAVAYDRWGDHCAESLTAFERFFTACPTCELRAQATRKHLEIKARCRIEVVLDSVPGGAQLTVNGADVGVTPVTLPLDAGRHAVTALRPGYQRLETEIRVEPGGQTRHLLRLDPAEVAAPPPPPPPVAEAPPPPTIVGSLAPLPEERTNLTPWTWTAFGVGAAGAAVGAVFTLQTLNALDAEEQARADRRPKREVEALQGDAVDRAVIAHVGFGVAAAGLVTGIILLIADDEAPAPDAEALGAQGGEAAPAAGGFALTPTLGPGGLGVVGRF